MEEQLRNLAAMMDHTLLKADATKESLLQVCRECEQWHFRMIAINSAQVSLCAEALRNTEVHVGAAISFPLGQTERTIKLMECEQAIHHGADEIVTDFPDFYGFLKARGFETDEARAFTPMSTIVRYEWGGQPLK